MFTIIPIKFVLQMFNYVMYLVKSAVIFFKLFFSIQMRNGSLAIGHNC